MNRFAVFFLWMSATVFCASYALAGKGIKKFDVGDTPDLELNNVAGDIQIIAGRSDQIKITFIKTNDDIKVEMKQLEGGRVRVSVDYPNRSTRNSSVDFKIEFPPSGGRLQAQSVSGNVSLADVQGNLRLGSVSGRINVQQSGGDLDLNSVSGDVRLRDMGSVAVEVDASSISGDIDYSGGNLTGGDYSFSSTSGNINVNHGDDASYAVSGRTVSGSIRNRTGSSDIQVKKAKYGPTSSVSGSFNGGKVRLRVNTVSGSINLVKD